MRLNLSGTATLTDGLALGTLPVGYRPTYQGRYINYSGQGMLNIASTGDVAWVQTSGTTQWAIVAVTYLVD